MPASPHDFQARKPAFHRPTDHERIAQRAAGEGRHAEAEGPVAGGKQFLERVVVDSPVNDDDLETRRVKCRSDAQEGEREVEKHGFRIVKNDTVAHGGQAFSLDAKLWICSGKLTVGCLRAKGGVDFHFLSRRLSSPSVSKKDFPKRAKTTHSIRFLLLKKGIPNRRDALFFKFSCVSSWVRECLRFANSKINCQKMSFAQALLNEFKQEAAVTRKHLEKVPFDKLEFKPHEKSETLGRLAIHVAEIIAWWKIVIEKDELDFIDFEPKDIQSTEELLSYFDELLDKAEQTLLTVKDEEFNRNWAMRHGEDILFTLPKRQVVRTFCLNHLIHHRAQLGIYLRLLEITVPASYGPSADDEEVILIEPYQ